MKVTLPVIFFLLPFFVNAQGMLPELITIPVNSSDLRVELICGKEKYSMKEDKIHNTKYYIFFREKSKEINCFKANENNEGNDIISPFEGTNTDINLEGSFTNGYKNGFWKTLYQNKLVKTENYRDGLMIGRYRVYNTAGEVLYKTTFGSVGNGMYKDYYYATGTLKEEGRYENGKKEGKWHQYGENGNLTTTMLYKDGMPQEEE